MRLFIIKCTGQLKCIQCFSHKYFSMSNCPEEIKNKAHHSISKLLELTKRVCCPECGSQEWYAYEEWVRCCKIYTCGEYEPYDDDYQCTTYRCHDCDYEEC